MHARHDGRVQLTVGRQAGCRMLLEPVAAANCQDAKQACRAGNLRRWARTFRIIRGAFALIGWVW